MSKGRLTSSVPPEAGDAAASRGSVSRREMLRAAARYTSLGALAVLAVVLGRRGGMPGGDADTDARPQGAAGRQTCDSRFICASCSSLGSCPLPQAMSLKAARSPS